MATFDQSNFDVVLDRAIAMAIEASRPPQAGPLQAVPIKVMSPAVRHESPVQWNPRPSGIRADHQISTLPGLRPIAPIMTILDEDSLVAGEHIRIPGEVYAIGRTHGDLKLSGDATMSARHAEIRLTVEHGRHVWTLHDLASANGTFVRVAMVGLTPERVLIVGTRRFRFVGGGAMIAEWLGSDHTRMVRRECDSPGSRLEEVGKLIGGLIFPLQKRHVTIGRKGNGCDIEIDDPTLAPFHAELHREADDGWKLVAAATRSGVWASSRETPLVSGCFFQCGEHRFRFVVPAG